MNQFRRILRGILIILAIPVALLVAVPIALLLAGVFYGLTLLALVRTFGEFILKGSTSPRAKPAAESPADAGKIASSSQVQADGF
jgi:hypothetical protein